MWPPQLGQLRTDVPDTSQNLESSGGNQEGNQMYNFEDVSPDDHCAAEDTDTPSASVSSVKQLAEERSHTKVLIAELRHVQSSIQDDLEIVSPDLTKVSETSISLSLGRCNDSPVFLTVPLPIPESPPRYCEATEPSLNIFESNNVEENATGIISPVSFHNVDTKTEELLANLLEDYCVDIIQNQGQHESALSTHETRTEEKLIQTTKDNLTYLCQATSVEVPPNEDLSSQSPSEFTPVALTSSRLFSFEKQMSYVSPEYFEASSGKDRPKTSGPPSEDSLSAIDSECFDTQPTSAEPKVEMTTSDEEYCVPHGYTESQSTTTIYTKMPPHYTEDVHSGSGSPNSQFSDREQYFDCKLAPSDFSETEPDRPDQSTRTSGDQSRDQIGCLNEKYSKHLLSAEDEDYEDAPFGTKILYNNDDDDDEENGHYSEALAEASQPHPGCEFGAISDEDRNLTWEITAELGSMSESSDEDFLTTRIVRRRVVIKADEMPDLPTHSVTEEKYKDENGHIVTKKVTRKIIRKCVSVDGVEHDQVSTEGDPQSSFCMTEGGGHSRVVKRTILKSEGGHTEVTFTECEGSSASRQETGEARKVSHIERTTEVEGTRTVKQQGDPSLAFDLPSAKDDFKQALGYMSGFSRTKLPHVVERETVKEDGTVVRRAHMRKSRTLKRTVVKETGQPTQVLLGKVGNPRKGPKPSDLQKHLQQLFHRYYNEEKEDSDEEEDEEEE